MAAMAMPSTNSESSPQAVLVSVAESTSLHGVPNAYHARSWIRKTVWSILFIASCGMCLYQVASNVKKYFDYPTISKSAVVTGHQLEFPAVTFCNMNPVRKSHMNETVLEELSVENDHWDNVLIFQQWYAPLDLKRKKKIGHSLNHMLLSCEFAGEKCPIESFTHVRNGQYGNCYTFNGGDAENRFLTSSVGPGGGLILELYIQQDEYLPILSDIAGIRIVIHNQTYMPLPEQEGIILAPGMASNIAISRTEERRAKPPHGKCADVSAEKNEELNVYTDIFDYVDYTYQACRFTCYQQNVIENCKCGDAAYPLAGKPFLALNGDDAKPCQSEEEQLCVLDQTIEFNQGEDNCTTACPLMCLEIFYEKKFSFGLWPSLSAEDKIYKKINKTLGEDGLEGVLENIDGNEAAELAWMQNNVVKVMVYFERLDYSTHTTEESYTITNLLSDQGGQVGLWLGLSMLTMFEMVELLWDLVSSVFYVSKKTAPASTESKEPPAENLTS